MDPNHLTPPYPRWTVVLVTLFPLFFPSLLSQSVKDCTVPLSVGKITPNYFLFCKIPVSSYELRRNTIRSPNLFCHDQDRLRLLDFTAWLPTRGTTGPCPPTQFRYKKKVNTSCLTESQRNEVMLPFLETLSGKTIKAVRNMDDARFTPNRYDYNQISLTTVCESKESDLKMDMCGADSRQFKGFVNVSLFFNREDYVNHQSNYSSCYCKLQYYNTSIAISARAFDIRIQRPNELRFNSRILDRQLYWWQSGVLTKDLQDISLTGMAQNSIPDSVWINIYGRNVEIACDTKPVVIPRKPGPSGTSNNLSSSGMDSNTIMIIVGSVAGAGVLIIFIACYVKRCKSRDPLDMSDDDIHISRRKGARKKSDAAFDDSSDDENAFRPLSESTYQKLDQQIEYSKVMKKRQSDDYSGDEDGEVFELKSEMEQKRNVRRNTSPAEDGSKNELVYIKPLIHKENIYDHFDQPDVIPSSPNNIYDTSAVGIYSPLETKPQFFQSEPTYDATHHLSPNHEASHNSSRNNVTNNRSTFDPKQGSSVYDATEGNSTFISVHSPSTYNANAANEPEQPSDAFDLPQDASVNDTTPDTSTFDLGHDSSLCELTQDQSGELY